MSWTQGLIQNQTTLKGLPYGIAAKLKVAADTWSEETKKLAQELEDTKGKDNPGRSMAYS